MSQYFCQSVCVCHHAVIGITVNYLYIYHTEILVAVSLLYYQVGGSILKSLRAPEPQSPVVSGWVHNMENYTRAPNYDSITSNYASLDHVDISGIYQLFDHSSDIYLIVYGMIRSDRLIIRGSCVLVGHISIILAKSIRYNLSHTLGNIKFPHACLTRYLNAAYYLSTNRLKFLQPYTMLSSYCVQWEYQNSIMMLTFAIKTQYILQSFFQVAIHILVIL